MRGKSRKTRGAQGAAMDHRKQEELRRIPEKKIPTTQDSLRPVVAVIELGDVSAETKGTVHGLELGLLPRF